MAAIESKLMQLINNQLRSHFLPTQETISKENIEEAIYKFIYCTSNAKGKYYDNKLDINCFYNSDKYAIFLYYLSRVMIEKNKIDIATHIYYLNKILHSIDLFYEVEMPSIFLLVHPVGSVVGRAKYNDYFCLYQNCTIGSDTHNGISHYPIFGKKIIMYAGSKVIGKCNIGNNCIFGANSFIINVDIPDDSVVVGIYPNHRILNNKTNIFKNIFKL